MGFEASEQAAIIELMHGKYRALLTIETEWGIRLHEGDWRPRIEHFHDAVRALTSGSADLYATNARLSVENLAYDLGQLRQIQSKPIGLINRATEKSAGSALVKQSEAGAHIPVPKLPPSDVRAQLVSLYRDYMVFFAALFAQVADINYQSRTEAMETTASDLAMIEDVMGKLLAGKLTQAQALNELMHVERDDLRERIQALLARKSLTPRDRQEALAMMAQIGKGMKEERDRLDQAHLHYATGQLAVYEASKDTIQRIHREGLNLAGKFVENAMAAAGKGKSRGV